MKTFSKKPGKEEKRDVTCAVCGSDKKKERWRFDSFSFSLCQVCGLLYQYPQPVQRDLEVRYDNEYFAYEIENEGKFFELMLKSLSDVGLDEYIGSRKKLTHSFLDIGCATGILLEHMRNEGWEVRGVEVCPESAAYGREERGLNIFTGTLDDAVFGDESFSVVHSSHLIEHLTDPRGFVKEAFRILKPGGLLITTTPNTASLQALVKGPSWRSVIADHMYLFSISNLGTMLKNAGFSIFRWKTWGGIPAGEAPIMLKWIVDRLVKSLGFGDVMVIAAKKPDYSAF